VCAQTRNSLGVLGLAHAARNLAWRCNVGDHACVFPDMERRAAIARSNAAASTNGGFEGWVRASSPHLRRLAYLLTGDLDQAEDLLQEAYAKVFPRWRKVSAYDSPDAYMYRVMVNLRTSWWRRTRNRESSTNKIPEPFWHAGSPGEAEAVVESQVLLSALRALPERQRAAVVLRYWCDLSEAATATAMTCSVGSVKSNASRGLAKLRTALAETHDSPDTLEGDLR
jgi:RNA polymerase sigma-70 factor (sigma-E family)